MNQPLIRRKAYLILEFSVEGGGLVNIHIWSSPPWHQSGFLNGNHYAVGAEVTADSFHEAHQDLIDNIYVLAAVQDCPKHRQIRDIAARVDERGHVYMRPSENVKNIIAGTYDGEYVK